MSMDTIARTTTTRTTDRVGAQGASRDGSPPAGRSDRPPRSEPPARSRSRSGRSGSSRGRPGAGGSPLSHLGAGLDLAERSRVTLLAAARAGTTTDRYLAAQLAALRAGAALLAAGGALGGGAVRDVWSALGAQRPEFAEWAAYFAAATPHRRDVEAGSARPAPREADDAVRAADTFLGLVQAALGVPLTPVGAVLRAASLS